MADKPQTEPTLSEIDLDAISPASLRAEFRRGRLEMERVGRTDFTTLRAINEMRKKCTVPSPVQERSGNATPSESDAEQALHAARLRLARAKQHAKAKGR
ncbi:hypothetical protein OF122_18185 [Pelagibacterium flavum]|uniref:Uncharacterized protein n=1 Tax=Pelagibacterium flavum TaxID=2984530 RepID=A0ABY6IMX5_9HYPH|nr:hypothetical protein [Pelagibacterium sp. YIM 151497]UYQ71944.1 hypothetical protein OF122_18185 [Pelagibacterium sp. YIM 151497]